MSKPTCIVDDCEDESFARKMCKPHYRKDYYQRNKERENASNKAYREAHPEYWKSRWADYAERRWEAERTERRKALEDRLAASHKTCTQCAEHLPKTAFYEDPRRLDGRYSWCIECHRVLTEATEDKDRRRDRGRRYYADPDRRERMLERHRKWSTANPEVGRENASRRRARIGATETEKVDFAAIIERDGMVCHICGDDIPDMSDLHFDHVIPLSKGGAHSYDNIKPSHAACNLRKGAKILPAA